MIKRALQLGELMITPINTLNEDFSVSNSLVNSEISDGSVFITPIYSGKEIIITGTYIFDDRLPYIPKRNGIQINKSNYFVELHNLAKKTVKLYAIGIDNRIYQIEVLVASVKMQEQSQDTFDFTIQAFSESSTWEDVTSLVCYYAYLGSFLNADHWRYNYEITYKTSQIQDWQLMTLYPDNWSQYQKLSTNNKDTITVLDRSSLIKNKGKSKLYLHFFNGITLITPAKFRLTLNGIIFYFKATQDLTFSIGKNIPECYSDFACTNQIIDFDNTFEGDILYHATFLNNNGTDAPSLGQFFTYFFINQLIN